MDCNLKIEEAPYIEKSAIHMPQQFSEMLRVYTASQTIVPTVKVLRSLFHELSLKEARAIVKNVCALRFVATYHNMVVVSLETDL